MSPSFLEKVGAASRKARGYRSVRSAFLAVAAMIVACSQFAEAAPGIRAKSEAQSDGPIKYTVTIDSKTFGRERATRMIRSGQSDDFTWQDSVSNEQSPVPKSCPAASDLPRSGEGAPVRQIQVRLTPVVQTNGEANVQITFRGYLPQGTKEVTVGSERIRCPVGTAYSQVLRFTMATATGSAKTVTLGDNTKITVTVSRK